MPVKKYKEYIVTTFVRLNNPTVYLQEGSPMTPNSIRLLCVLVLLFASSMTKAQTQSRYSVGESHLCTLQDTGVVNCIVSSGFERLLPPESLPELVAVSTGETHTCGITLDGEAVCWGDNNFGQLDVPAIPLPLTQINAGHNHTCAVDSAGQAHCWGLNSNRQTEPPGGALFTKVHAAFTSSCGILVNGDITCWSTDGERAPADLTGPFVDLDMQTQGVCGLTATGDILCNALINALVPPLTDGSYSDLATTLGAVCGLNTGNELECNTSSFSFAGTPDFADFPLGEQFLSIESVESGFTGIGSSRETRPIGTTMCGERLDGSLQCWSPSTSFPDIDNPTSTTQELLTNMRLDMDARIYGSTSLELFWTPVPSAGSDVEVEIFRNGALLDRVGARQSYFDGNALSSNTYQIRLIDDSGNVGPLSPELFADTASNTVLFNGEPPLIASRQDVFSSEQVFTSLRRTAVASGSLVFWTIDPEQQALIDGYEIELNGERAGFTRSQLYLNLEERVTSCIRVSAIGFGGEILDTENMGSSCD